MSIAIWLSSSMPRADSINCLNTLSVTMFLRACLMWRHLNGSGKVMQWQLKLHLHPAAGGESPTLTLSSERICKKADRSITTNNIYDHIKIISQIIMYSDTIWCRICEGKQMIH